MEEFVNFLRRLLNLVGLAKMRDGEKHRPRKRLLFSFCVAISLATCYLLWLDGRLILETPFAFVVMYISTISSYIGHNLHIKISGTSNDDDLPGDLIVFFVLIFCAGLGVLYGLTQAGAALPLWIKIYRIPQILDWVYASTIALFTGSIISYYRLSLLNNKKNHPEKQQNDQGKLP